MGPRWWRNSCLGAACRALASSSFDKRFSIQCPIFRRIFPVSQIQLISGHESKKSLEVYQHLSLESVDKAYQDAVQTVGI
jgi:hypothetical protein